MARTRIQIGRSDHRRGVPYVPTIALKNRYFEENPVLTTDGVSLIARPRLKKFAEVGPGHIRKVYSEPGTFDGDLFVVSGIYLYRVDRFDGTSSLLGQISQTDTGAVEMAAAADIGTTPARLFIAEGELLWVYMEEGPARGHLENVGASIANNDTVTINGVYYKFTTGSVDTGTPDGSSGSPWLVARTGINATDFGALYHAINDSGTPGTEYSTALTKHPDVEAYNYTPTDLYVAANEYGTAGNAITISETGANLAWDAATLTQGGDPLLRQVLTPNDEGAISVAHINQYIIVVPNQDTNKGRFYWIEPGEITIDPLNFATAERSPDAINQVVVFSDMFWLCGQISTEPWITTGDLDAPMTRFKGILYDRGCWEGTALKINDYLMMVDQHGGVWRIGGGLKRVSTPAVEERLRTAMQLQALYG